MHFSFFAKQLPGRFGQWDTEAEMEVNKREKLGFSHLSSHFGWMSDHSCMSPMTPALLGNTPLWEPAFLWTAMGLVVCWHSLFLLVLQAHRWWYLPVIGWLASLSLCLSFFTLWYYLTWVPFLDWSLTDRVGYPNIFPLVTFCKSSSK